MRLSVALNGYWLDKQLDFSPNTTAKYRRVFARLSTFLGDTELERVETEDIRRFLIHLRERRGLGRRSVHDAWAVLSSLWTWAAGEFGIPHIIRGQIPAPEYTRRKLEPYTDIKHELGEPEIGELVEIRDVTGTVKEIFGFAELELGPNQRDFDKHPYLRRYI